MLIEEENSTEQNQPPLSSSFPPDNVSLCRRGGGFGEACRSAPPLRLHHFRLSPVQRPAGQELPQRPPANPEPDRPHPKLLHPCRLCPHLVETGKSRERGHGPDGTSTSLPVYKL